MAVNYRRYGVVVCLSVVLFGLLYMAGPVNHAMTSPRLGEDEDATFSQLLQNSQFDNTNNSGNYKNVTLLLKGISRMLNKIKPTTLSDSNLGGTSYPDEHYFDEERKVHEIDCAAIFQGDDGEIKKAENISALNKNINRIIPDEEYINMTKDCVSFVTNRGYILSSLTEEEEQFPIAYSLLLYKDVGQSERLLRAIYRPQNIYCVHVDSKSDVVVYKAMAAIVGCFDNVFMSPVQYDVQWGTMTVLEPELACMKELSKRNKLWKYFINLTGQEFPLRTNSELVKILRTYNGANDVEVTVKRANTNRWEKAGPPPHGIVPVKGSVHVVVNRQFVDYILHNETAHALLNWSREVSVPDETFFSTLNHNPQLGIPGSYTGEPESTEQHLTRKPFMARFKNWGAGNYIFPCHGQRVRMICVFGTGDLPILSTRKEMFTNKFYTNYHPYAYDCIEELHYNHTRDEYLGKLKFDTSWYASLGFVKDKIPLN